MSPLLAVERLTKSFAALKALNGVSLAVEPRERRALIGPNGAGKTTLFNLITGHLAPNGGRVLFEGEPLTARVVDPAARAAVGGIMGGTR